MGQHSSQPRSHRFRFRSQMPRFCSVQRVDLPSQLTDSAIHGADDGGANAARAQAGLPGSGRRQRAA